jgi:glucokinase
MPPWPADELFHGFFRTSKHGRTKMILAGDIGGTNSRLGLFDDQRKNLRETVKKNAGRAGLEDVVREFLNETQSIHKGHIDRACFGVAGPVAGGKVHLTNLSWNLEEHSLAKALGIPKLALINDMVAHAEGVELLEAKNLIALNAGHPIKGGDRAVIAAGTGLGEAGLFWDARLGGYRAIPSESGHADFAPRTPVQIRLLQFLLAKLGSVSWENVLSGRGTRHIYDFFISPAEMGPAAALPNPDPDPADITVAGMAKSNPACVAALELFADCYAAEAGNLALRLLATGGIYIGGGIAMKMLPYLQHPSFIQRFADRGPAQLREMLKRVPIHVINFDLGALLGAANYASRL